MAIYRKLLILSLIFTIIPIIFVGLLGYSVSKTSIQKEIIDRLSFINDSRAWQIQNNSDYDLSFLRLGKTGETLIGKKEGNRVLFLKPTRFDGGYRQKPIIFGDKYAGALKKAVRGEAGFGEEIDYRGKKVLAVWKYIPSLDIGVVTKIDIDEAYEPVYKLRNSMFIILIITMLLDIILIVLVAKRISDPILDIQNGLNIIGAGNLDCKVGTSSKDEVGVLSRAFDQMVENIRKITASRDELEWAQVKIKHLNSVLRAIRDINQLILREHNLQKLLDEACSILTQSRGYNLVWLGLISEEHKRIVPNACSGESLDYLNNVTITWDETETGRGPTGNAIKGKKPFVSDDLLTDPNFMPWRKEALACGFASAASMPMIYGDEVFGVINVYSKIPGFFSNEEIYLLHELAGDIAFAMHAIKIEINRKEAKEEIENKNNELEEALRIKSDFTSTVSHELRTPLTSIKEGLSLVLDPVTGDLNDKQKEFLIIAKRNVDRLHRMINGVLDFSKLEARKVEFKIKLNDIILMAEDVVNAQKNIAEQKGLKINLEIKNEIPMLNFDLDKITQVLINLINNAAKFTEKGEIDISLAVAEDNKFLKVCVSDTGKGILEEDIPKLFHKFQQIADKDGRPVGGTGLGLAICKEIVEQHKGKIWVESKKGVGSTFCYTLPI